MDGIFCSSLKLSLRNFHSFRELLFAIFVNVIDFPSKWEIKSKLKYANIMLSSFTWSLDTIANVFFLLKETNDFVQTEYIHNYVNHVRLNAQRNCIFQFPSSSVWFAFLFFSFQTTHKILREVKCRIRMIWHVKLHANLTLRVVWPNEYTFWA